MSYLYMLRTPDSARQNDILSLACNALDLTARFLAYPPLLVRSCAAQTAWRGTMHRALSTTRHLRPSDCPLRPRVV